MDFLKCLFPRYNEKIRVTISINILLIKKQPQMWSFALGHLHCKYQVWLSPPPFPLSRCQGA